MIDGHVHWKNKKSKNQRIIDSRQLQSLNVWDYRT
jgi:hypothetical protein